MIDFTTQLVARLNVFEFAQLLYEGDTTAWIALAVLAGCIAFFALYEKVTGRPFVKSRQERREARNRRKFVLFEYKRDS